ncbi:MAG: hypothetical protein ACI8Y4_003719 [Candidatus Poriferisodalaceae bacterium]|jgi:uncharacterized protein YndB with AHSA1/START domain
MADTQYPTTGSASVRIAASPEAAYAYVTDLDKAPGLSPENQSCVFTGDSTEIVVGATFAGTNRAGDYEWTAECQVKSADPGREFSFKVPPEWEYGTIWKYTFEPDGDGVTVTEAFDSPMLGDPEIYPGKIEGRCEQLTAACQTTLDNLKAALEA